MAYAGPANRGTSLPIVASSGAARGAESLAPLSLPRQPRQPLTPMRLERRHGAAKFAAGLAIGLAIGAGVALLFAPQSGEDTRQSIARRGRRMGRHLRQRGHDAWGDLAFELKRARRQWHRRRHRAKVNGAP